MKHCRDHELGHGSLRQPLRTLKTLSVSSILKGLVSHTIALIVVF
jgi:hypothetical protein